MNPKQDLIAKRDRYHFWARADIMRDGAISPRTQQKLTHAVPHINAALAAIENGTYGICRDCGEEIPEGRLKVVPGATRCRPCQEDQEQ